MNIYINLKIISCGTQMKNEGGGPVRELVMRSGTVNERPGRGLIFHRRWGPQLMIFYMIQ